MFGFANPQAFWLLLLIPLFTLVFLAARLNRKKKLKAFGHKEVITPLMPEASPYKPLIKFILQMLILTMVIIAIARPRAGTKTTQGKAKGIEVMVALDVSRSMDASATVDPNGVSRLQRSTMFLEKLMARLNNDKVGVVVFAGNAYSLMPITSDHSSARLFISSANTGMVSEQGTAIGEALELCRNSFTQNAKTQKAIIVITDAENRADDAIAAAKETIDKGIQVNVAGVGTGDGAKIPTGNGQFLTDDNGNEVVTRLDEKTAREIASTGKGIYVSVTDNGAVDAMVHQLSKLAQSDMEVVVYNKHDEQFPIFAIIALILILIDFFVVERQSSWLRNINLFSKQNEKSGK